MKKIIRCLLFSFIGLTSPWANSLFAQPIPYLYTTNITGKTVQLDTVNKNLIVFTNTLSCSACEKNLLQLLSDLNIDTNITITVVYSFGQDVLQRRLQIMKCSKLFNRKCSVVFEDANYQTRAESYTNSVFLSSINGRGVPLLILVEPSKKAEIISYQKLFDETVVSEYGKSSIKKFIK